MSEIEKNYKPRILRQLKHRAQTLVDRVLRPRRQRSDVPGQETAIQCQELGTVDRRIAGQSCRARPQQHISRRVREVYVACDDRYFYSLNAAAVEGSAWSTRTGRR
jgi:hypothetical protein